MASADEWHEECGVVGVFNGAQSLDIACMALHALQHRGQESCGVAVANGVRVRHYRKMGLVTDLVRKVHSIQNFEGHIVIGHNRYSTTGNTNLVNAQPILIDYKKGQLAIAHNGNLINAMQMRRKMEDSGSIFQSTSDSEAILHLVARSIQDTVPAMILDSLRQVKGAYSVLFCTEDTLIAARDPLGVRPMCLGKLPDGGYIVASETCAFDLVRAEYIRDIEPGEMLVINKDGLQSDFIEKRDKPAHCIFEYIYFSRPDSRIFNHSVDRIRRSLGKKLAEEAPVKGADMIISVPDSSNTAALGFASASGIPFEIGLVRNHYVGRTFIAPDQSDRDLKVRLKFNPVAGLLRGKKIVLVEDSIVRGTTLRQLTTLLRSADVAEVHIRVSSPPILEPCFYGMDFPSTDELIASDKTTEEIRKYLNVDSLAYLTIDGLKACAPDNPDHYCYACFCGKYPYHVSEKVKKEVFEKC